MLLSKLSDMKRILFFLLPFFLLSSCIDIVDDLTINNDGSGKLKLSVNLSKSKLEVNSILALDSLRGQRVPKLNEITAKIPEYTEKLRKQKGIESVMVEQDTVNFILKLTIHFNNVEDLESALKEVVSEENTTWVNFDFDWIKWENHTLTRNMLNVPNEQIKKLKYEDVQKLKTGTYTSVTHFQTPIISYTNESSVLSPNKQNLMIKTSAYLLTEDTQSLKNQIKVSGNSH